jgi:hypothetical protein
MMKRNFHTINIAILTMVLAVATYSCARYLKTEGATVEEISGVYTLILYGGTSANDIKTIAILAKEGTPYSFEVFQPESDYKIIKGIPAKEALEKARKFVSFHPDFWKIQLSKILDNKGSTIGYEVRPLYNPSVYDKSDLPDVNYKIADGKVIVYINFYPYPAPEPMPFEGGRSFGPR